MKLNPRYLDTGSCSSCHKSLTHKPYYKLPNGHRIHLDCLDAYFYRLPMGEVAVAPPGCPACFSVERPSKSKRCLSCIMKDKKPAMRSTRWRISKRSMKKRKWHWKPCPICNKHFRRGDSTVNITGDTHHASCINKLLQGKFCCIQCHKWRAPSNMVCFGQKVRTYHWGYAMTWRRAREIEMLCKNCFQQEILLPLPQKR